MKMNIALFVQRFNTEMPEANKLTALLLAKEYKRLGHDVCIISQPEKGVPESTLIEGISVYRYGKPISFKDNRMKRLNPVRFWRSLTCFWKCVEHVESKQKRSFDIVHSFSSAPLMAIRLWLTKTKAKKIHTIKSHSRFSNFILYPGSYFYSFMLNCVDSVTTPSKVIKKLLKKWGCKVPINIVRSHIDLNRFSPQDKQTAKNKINVKSPLILYYGPVVERKGVSYLLQAAPFILSNIPHAQIICVNKLPNLNEKYQKLLSDLRFTNIKVMHKTANIEQWVNAADVVVLPYPHLKATEVNPSCILESMACKTPVITAQLPELTELFEHRKEILFFQKKSVYDLSNKIVYALQHKDEMDAVVNNAFQRITEFSSDIIAEQYLSLYNALICKK